MAIEPSSRESFVGGVIKIVTKDSREVTRPAESALVREF